MDITLRELLWDEVYECSVVVVVFNSEVSSL